MVRYRQEGGERTYTFRLANNSHPVIGNGNSPSGTLSDRLSIGSDDHAALDTSIAYKERIDSLFRDRSHHGHNASSKNNTGVETVKADEPTMEHLKMHFQKVLAEHRGTTNGSVASKAKSTTYIHITNQANNGNGTDSNDNDQGKKKVESNTENNQRSFSAAASRSQSFNEARNAVQAQIEKMFQDAAKVGATNQQEDVTFNQTKAIITVRASAPVQNSSTQPTAPQNKQNTPLPPIPTISKISLVTPTEQSTSTPINATPEKPVTDRPTSLTKYKVDYLGCLALQGRATSLESLQMPLKDLYSRYRHSLVNKLNIYRGTLEISAAGLRIQYYSDWRTVIPVEILNPFPTIAVWAAVKFVCRTEQNTMTSQKVEVNSGKKFAFLPLICDPENQEKQNLFHYLSSDDGDILSAPSVVHPPMFTCVMRKMSSPKVLECHAFVCDNPEDAIVIAANLYQALLRNMKTADKPDSNGKNNKSTVNPSTVEHSKHSSEARAVKPSTTEPLYSPDTSVSNWSDSSATSCSAVAPVRPPRRKKKSDSGLVSTGLEKRKSIRRSNSKARASQAKPNLRRSMRSSSQRSQRVKRSVSERQIGNMLAQTQITDGDILTKVAIPRSKSFMTVPQNYSIGELFDELKKQEGVQSVDDVLKLIVNKDRMSFNDLQPAYKELLMKLALTLSKDEMFQRSKNIMRNQTTKSHKTRSSALKSKARDSDAEHSSSSRISSVLRATRKSLSKWSVRSTNGYSVSSKDSLTNNKMDSFIKTTSKSDPLKSNDVAPAPMKNFAPKTPLPLRSAVIPNKNGISINGHHHGKSQCAKESQNPDEYISCSECAYDSESCSQKCYCSFNDAQSKSITSTYTADTDDCSDGEKCYCSLSRIKTGPNGTAPVYRINLDSDSDASHTSQMSSSCSSLEPGRPNYKQSRSRQDNSRKTGSLTSWTALSGAESPLTAWRRNTVNMYQHSQNNNVNSSRFNNGNAASLRKKSLSSYLSDTSLDSDIVAMTEPAKKSSASSLLGGTAQPSRNTFAKNPDFLRQKSRSSCLSSETELESLTTSCNSFVRAPLGINVTSGRKASPSESVGYQSYDSTGSSNGKNSRHFHSTSSESLSNQSGRRNSNSSSDRSQNGNRSNKKVLMVSAVDPKGKIVYRGTSSAGTAQHRSQAAGPAEGVLSVKKTAEIAAMFSNLKLNQTTDIIIDHSETEDTESDLSANDTDDAYSSMRFRPKPNGFSNGLENSLGYLP